MSSTLARSIGPRSPLTRLLRPLVNPLIPDRTTAVRVLTGPARGLRMPVELQREKYYVTGGHELEVQRALVGALTPGATFWDIGAHIGFFSLLAARLVGPRGVVHAFEPLAENRSRLEAAARLNGFENIRVHAIAVTDHSGEATLHSRRSTLMWTLVPERGEAGDRRVVCETMDDLAARLGPPDVLKIDVEGAEVDVLRGGRRLLATRRPVVVVETTGGAELAESRTLLAERSLDLASPRHLVAR